MAALLKGLVSLPNHRFWPDDPSVLDEGRFDHARLLSSTQVTASHLLALAVVHGGQLATFDRKLAVDAVHGASQGRHLI